MKIRILVDNPDSWYFPYAETLVKELAGNDVKLITKVEELEPSEVACFLSCQKLIKKPVLEKNKYNIVVHSSPLPKGKGWSPLTWQILEGKNEITSTLFEAVEAVDAGKIYFQETVIYEGHELLSELHGPQGESINRLVKKFVDNIDHLEPKEQEGEETFYRRRKPEDGELDPNLSIVEQFNLLRVSDNEAYPAFFNWLGHKYILKIYKADEVSDKQDK